MSIDNYSVEGASIVRELRVGGVSWRSRIENRSDASEDGFGAWWQSFLRGATVSPEMPFVHGRTLRTVDAFCGCGGLTLGAREAATAAGMQLEAVAAVDVDEGALQLHRTNFGTRKVVHASASSLVDFHVTGVGKSARFAYQPEMLHRALASEVGHIDLFLAGPPCQGHSNLNNKTRREDPRNLLYLTAIALAVGLESQFIVIENVPDVVNDKSDVVSTAKALLASSGYRFVDSGVLAAHQLGGAQTRKRFFLIASRNEVASDHLTLRSVAATMRRPPRSVGWAIGDLLGLVARDDPMGVMDSVPALSDENRGRVEYLFRHELFDLPNDVRPECHRNGHTYPSVYGRMYWDKPSQTITTGFLTPGRGRFIHPLEPRVITPREAARIQGFPDTFRFVVGEEDPPRTAVCKWIGDAVPPLLGFTATLPLLVGL